MRRDYECEEVIGDGGDHLSITRTTGVASKLVALLERMKDKKVCITSRILEKYSEEKCLSQLKNMTRNDFGIAKIPVINCEGRGGMRFKKEKGAYSLENNMEFVWMQEQRVLQHDDEDIEILGGVKRTFLEVIRHQQQSATERAENLKESRKNRIG